MHVQHLCIGRNFKLGLSKRMQQKLVYHSLHVRFPIALVISSPHCYTVNIVRIIGTIVKQKK